MPNHLVDKVLAPRKLFTVFEPNTENLTIEN